MGSDKPCATVEEEIKEHGTYATNTVGTSMRPLFKTNRDVVLLKAPEREIRKYDVVFYSDAKGRHILHRVIGFREDCLIIRGDNTFVKEYVPRERVVAYMVAFNRNGKRHSTDEFGYKLYSRLWHYIYPLRLLWRKMRSLLGKIKRSLFKKKT